MQLIVNGQSRQTPDGITVARLLSEGQPGPPVVAQVSNLWDGHTGWKPVPPQVRVAVELNGQVVPRAEFANVHLRDGDRLEVVTLVGGG
jgi:sulfur carrier protein ThiS